MRMRAMLVALVMLVVAGQVSAATITVQRDGTGDYGVIQQALDVAAAGDTVLIGPGEYTEWTMVRLPGSGYDIKSFAHLRSDDLTIIGAGVEHTIIGPVTYEGNGGTFSPKGITYQVGYRSLHMSDLTVRHCYAGVDLAGTLYMDRCRLEDNSLGLFWGTGMAVGAGGWVRDTVQEVTETIFDPDGFDIGSGGAGSDILMEGCRLSHNTTIRGVQGMVIRDCVMEMTGINVYSGARVFVTNTRVLGGNVGVSQSLGGGSYCEVVDCELDGVYASLVVADSAPGGRFVVANSLLVGGAHGVLYSAHGAGSCTISGCDLTKGSGPIVECAISTSLGVYF